MNTEDDMVMSQCSMRGGGVYGPLFQPRIGFHYHFPIGTSFLYSFRPSCSATRNSYSNYRKPCRSQETKKKK